MRIILLFRTPLMRISLLALIIAGSLAHYLHADEFITLRERFDPDYQYHVTTRVDLKGELSIPVDKDKPPKLVKMNGQSFIDYDERILAADGKTATEKSIRQYRTIDFRRVIGDRPQEISLRPEVKRLVVMKRPHAKVPFSPDGPLTWGEIDMLRTDIFVPALAALLPTVPVKPGDTWRVGEGAVTELTDMEKIERGTLTAKFEVIETIGGRRVAHITLAGELVGVNEDGPNRQKLTGRLYFDLDAGMITYLSINGEHFLLDKNGGVHGKMAGEFVLVRALRAKAPSLADAELAKLGLEPSPVNSLLLYEEPELGVRLLHPRRWRVSRTARGQITLDESGGSGLLITVEPLARVPTANAYMQETRAFLEKQKAKLTRTSPPVRLANAPAELDQFLFEAQVGGQHVVMDYLIARQPNGGATFAARVLENDRDALVKEVERMARSLTLTRKLEGK
jgi:hypothetical protein